MIEVLVGTTTQRATKLYAPDTTVRTILEDNGVDYSATSIMLDGANLAANEMDKTLAALNKTTKCMLIAVVKANSAA